MSRKVLNTTTDLMSLVDSVQGAADQSVNTSTNKEIINMTKKNTTTVSAPANVAKLNDIDLTKFMVVGKVSEQDALAAAADSLQSKGSVSVITDKECIGFDVLGTRFMFMHSSNGGFFQINVSAKEGAHIIADRDADGNKLDAVISQKKINGWLSAMSGLYTGKWKMYGKGFMASRTWDDLSMEGAVKHVAFVRNTCEMTNIAVSAELLAQGIRSPKDLLDNQVGVCDYADSHLTMTSIATDIKGWKEEPVAQTIERRIVYRSWGMDNIVRGNGMVLRPAFAEFTNLDGVTISHKISTNAYLSSYVFGFALSPRDSRNYVAGKYTQKIARVEMARQYAETRKIVTSGNVVPSVIVASVMAPKSNKIVSVDAGVVSNELIGKLVCHIIGKTILPEQVCTVELLSVVNKANARMVAERRQPNHGLILA